MCLNETKIDDSISDEELAIPNFSFIRKDRTKYGGGVGIYIKSSIDYNVCNSLLDKDLEVLWIEIKVPKMGGVLLCSAYRPDTNALYRDKLVTNFEKATNYNPNVLILGDLNENILNGLSGTFIDFMCTLLNVNQLVTEPTRVTVTTSTLLDHVYTSFKDAHTETKVLKICVSDHYLVTTTIDSSVTYKHETVKCRSFKNFNDSSFNLDIARMCDLVNLNDFDDINDMWLLWKNKFKSICDKHAPIKEIRVRNKDDRPWVDADTISLMKERDRVHKLAVDKGDNNLFDTYKCMRNNVANVIKDKKTRYIHSMLEGTQVKEGNIWKAVNLISGKNKYNNGIPSELQPDDINKYFAQMGDKLAASFTNTVEPLWKGSSSIYDFSMSSISEGEVFEHLIRLPDKSKTDVLGLNSKLLRLSSKYIHKSLTFLFNHSLKVGIVPDDWKKARVTPLYKGKGSKLDPGNYRPISVISFISKILEKCVQCRLLNYLETHNFITVDQSAYLKNHSTSAMHKNK